VERHTLPDCPDEEESAGRCMAVMSASNRRVVCAEISPLRSSCCTAVKRLEVQARSPGLLDVVEQHVTATGEHGAAVEDLDVRARALDLPLGRGLHVAICVGAEDAVPGVGLRKKPNGSVAATAAPTVTRTQSSERAASATGNSSHATSARTSRSLALSCSRPPTASYPRPRSARPRPDRLHPRS
jgi:hypothetical protein